MYDPMGDSLKVFLRLNTMTENEVIVNSADGQKYWNANENLSFGYFSAGINGVQLTEFNSYIAAAIFPFKSTMWFGFWCKLQQTVYDFGTYSIIKLRDSDITLWGLGFKTSGDGNQNFFLHLQD